MTKEVSVELITAIELLHHLPNKEDENYQSVINGIYARVGHVWGEIKELGNHQLEEELNAFLYHHRVQPVGAHDQIKEIEIRKLQIIEIVQGRQAGHFSHAILELFWITGWEDLFIPRVFNPQMTQNALLRVVGTSRNRIKRLLWHMLREDWEKVENINEVITQGFSLLRERLYLLRMPVSRLVEESTQRTLQADAYLEAERYSELIRETSTLMRRIGGSTNPDALEALDEAHSNAHKILEELGELGEMKPDITVWDIQQDIQEHFGVTLTSKNPGHIIDPRNWKKIIQRHLIKAAYQTYPDLTNLIRLQSSIRGVRKSITAREELTDAQKLLLDDIVSHYSQAVIRKIFDEAFYRFALLFKRPR